MVPVTGPSTFTKRTLLNESMVCIEMIQCMFEWKNVWMGLFNEAWLDIHLVDLHCVYSWEVGIGWWIFPFAVMKRTNIAMENHHWNIAKPSITMGNEKHSNVKSPEGSRGYRGIDKQKGHIQTHGIVAAGEVWVLLGGSQRESTCLVTHHTIVPG